MTALRPSGPVATEAAEARFRAMWARGSLAHAWLLLGPPGVGKAALARRLADIVLSDPSADAAGSPDADLLIIGEDEAGRASGRDILIEEARQVGAFLRRTAARGGWRAVIVRRAERLNRNAANALLKLLEEPPPKVLIVLTCNAPGRLLPTIRSRCQVLRLAPLEEGAMQQLVARLRPSLDAGQRLRVASLSAGSPGRAQSLLDDSALAVQALVDRSLAQPAGATDLGAYELAEAVLNIEGGFSAFFGLLSLSICSTIRDDLSAAGEAGHPLLARRPAWAWAEICLELGRLHDEAERFNLDKRQTVLSGLGLLSG